MVSPSSPESYSPEEVRRLRARVAQLEAALAGWTTATGAPAGGQIGANPAPVFRDSAARTTVLNVDDDEGARYLRSRILRGAGFRVTEASNATDALRLASVEQPDVVLLDVRLPDMNGFD